VHEAREREHVVPVELIELHRDRLFVTTTHRAFVTISRSSGSGIESVSRSPMAKKSPSTAAPAIDRLSAFANTALPCVKSLTMKPASTRG
jgi:hypothetical protein